MFYLFLQIMRETIDVSLASWDQQDAAAAAAAASEGGEANENPKASDDQMSDEKSGD
jgi:hypothetical protein